MTSITRRGFFSRSGALLGGAMAAGCGQTQAQNTQQQAATPGTVPFGRVVDFHHHFWPDSYWKLANSTGGTRERWVLSTALETMDKAGIGTAMLSQSNWVPGSPYPTPAQLISLSRDCNELGAKLVSDHPTRFGLFATLMMLPNVEAALKEMEYALDTLKSDGIGLMSHYGDGVYLGDPALDPILEELNRRQVVAFVHPAEPWYSFRYEPKKSPVVIPGDELVFDTTRAIMNLLEKDVTTRFPNIKFIWPHVGGTAPYLLGRSAVLWRKRGPTFMPTYEGLVKMMGTFYYDTALSGTHMNMAAMQEIIPTSHILFGSDIPRAGHYTRDFLDLLPKTVAAADVTAIARGNAEVLFPRLRQQAT